jgi:hypothetical protein
VHASAIILRSPRGEVTGYTGTLSVAAEMVKVAKSA